jgi:hypothetical protein
MTFFGMTATKVARVYHVQKIKAQLKEGSLDELSD